MSPVENISPTRRTFLAAALSLVVAPPAFSANQWRFPEAVAISAEDIEWFRDCRAAWLDCEAGSPAIIPKDMTLETYLGEFDLASSDALFRLEPIVCAFFLHASFAPGTYEFRRPLDGIAKFTVTEDHIRLLQTTNWRASAVDCKRPYGDYTHFEIDMARVLGLPITRSAEGYDEIGADAEARMDGLHKQMLYVLQAYIEHAELLPGQWFIPYDGWEGIILPRCVPVPYRQIAGYQAAMGAIGMRSIVQTDLDLVVPKIHASVELFALRQ